MDGGRILRRRIAIIGGGAKGVAIAAKAKVLADLGCAHSPMVDVFEQNEIGSMWRPGGGYSDGDQFVCTSPHRDLGFPYEMLIPDSLRDGVATEADLLHWPPEAVGAIARNASRDGEVYPGVAEAMLGKYSVQRFLIERPRSALNLQRWVRSGTRRLTHAEFADYLRWAFGRASGQVTLPDGSSRAPVVRRRKKKVTEIQYREGQGKWSIICQGAPVNDPVEYDGVVITGNGEPDDENSAVPNDKRTDRAAPSPIWNSKTFWNNEPDVRRLVESKAEMLVRDTPSRSRQIPVAVIGGGGGAAAIAARIATYHPDVQVCIFGKTPALYGRHPSSFEEELYGNNVLWRGLNDSARRDFLRRLGGAVVWSYITDDLDKVTNVSYKALKFLNVSVTDDEGFPLEASFCAPDNERPALHEQEKINCAILIDASGLKRIERIKELCPGTLGDAVEAAFDKASGRNAKFDDIGPAFEFAGVPAGLHLPDLCSGAGPAAPNLMALGWLATQILWKYMA